MIDGGPSSEVPEDSSQHEELPDRLRVHSLARALGTTSRQVLDALTELDGRIRSAHSTVERVDAVRVRDLLASAPATVTTPAVETEMSVAGDADEPESRTMLETTTIERPEYMPLFVAPQPVERRPDSAAAEDPADSDDDDDFDGDSDGDSDSDGDEQADRPANRRRR
ncbi:MAG: ribonuclease E/G, partial [Mycobacterium sp.]